MARHVHTANILFSNHRCHVSLRRKKHDLAGKRIIIIGAGIAGLAFATAIERSWHQEHPKPQIVLYQRSANSLIDRGREGYTVGLLPESGLAALKELGLLDAALQSNTISLSGSESLGTLWTQNWQPMFPPGSRKRSEDGSPSRFIILVRHVLKDMLMSSLPTDAETHWNTGCDSVDVLDSGRVRVNLNDGTTDECDLLIAADGANSKVRSALLYDRTLDYTGTIVFKGISRFASEKPDPLKHKWGDNISGKGVAFSTSPVDALTGVWALSCASEKPRNSIRGDEAIRWKQEILDEVRQRGNMFREPFNQCIEATDPATLQVYSAMRNSPISHAQKLPSANVAVIGDANHRLGADMALKDAVDLAKQLSSCTSVRQAINHYDADSVPRSQKAIEKNRANLGLRHIEGPGEWLFVRTAWAAMDCFSWLQR